MVNTIYPTYRLRKRSRREREQAILRHLNRQNGQVMIKQCTYGTSFIFPRKLTIIGADFIDHLEVRENMTGLIPLIPTLVEYERNERTERLNDSPS